MISWKCIGLIVVIIACQALGTAYSQCQQVNGSSGIISDSYEVYGYPVIRRCWKVSVAAHHHINVSVQLPRFSTEERRNCDNAHVQVKMDGGFTRKFCGFDDSSLSHLLVNDSYLEVEFLVNSKAYGNGVKFSFRLKYFTKPSILGVKGINEARGNAVSWLKRKHNFFWGWKEDTPRAVTALYLSGGAQFNGSLTEEMMAKQAELRIALSLTWSSVSIERLSRFINGLLSTCLNPRQFYGHDLVVKLKKQLESAGNFTHPVAYLALCNANENWPSRSTSDLYNVLNSKENYRFVKDIQAFAVMALSCHYRRENSSAETDDLMKLYFDTIKRMKGYQQPDGSFGNPYTTALFTQALLEREEHADDWRMSGAVEYLIKELNDSGVKFLSVYATLPLLNGKTLVDIAHVNCTNNPRREGEDPVSEIKDIIGPKIRVQYSLYIGDQKDVIHTISLRVPTNSTAYRIMELAAVQDQKYKFKVETIGTVKHVYEIAGIPNDPEDGKFWLLYVKRRNGGLSHFTSSPEEYILEDGEHIIMWYKNHQI